MNTAKINNEINLTYPDSFQEMSEESLKRYYSSAENRWGVYDADRHIVLSVSWDKAGFFRAMTDAESYMIEVEATLCRSLLNYQRLTSYKLKIGSKKAQGIRFEYRVRDSVSIHVSDVVVFKYKKHFYAVQFIMRQTKASETLPEFDEVLKSITLG